MLWSSDVCSNIRALIYSEGFFVTFVENLVKSRKIMCNRTILDTVHGEESWLHLAVSFCILNNPSIFWVVSDVFYRTVWILHCKVTSVTELWRCNLSVVMERIEIEFVMFTWNISLPSFSLFLLSLSSIISFILFYFSDFLYLLLLGDIFSSSSSLSCWYFQPFFPFSLLKSYQFSITPLSCWISLKSHLRIPPKFYFCS